MNACNKVLLPLLVMISVLSAGCGSGGGAANDSNNNGSGSAPNTGSGSGAATALEQKYPLAQNGAFDSAGIRQSFMCIDESDTTTYYQLDFTPDGNVVYTDTGDTVTYSTANGKLAIDFSSLPAPGSSYSYQHGYHVTAGPLVLGFVGSVTVSGTAYAMACIATDHPFSDAVSQNTDVLCEWGDVVNSGGASYYHKDTYRFTLTPGHYAQRNHTSKSVFSGGGGAGGTVEDIKTDRAHGTYLFDVQSGDLIMGFLAIDFNQPSIDIVDHSVRSDGQGGVFVTFADTERSCTLQ